MGDVERAGRLNVECGMRFVVRVESPMGSMTRPGTVMCTAHMTGCLPQLSAGDSHKQLLLHCHFLSGMPGPSATDCAHSMWVQSISTRSLRHRSVVEISQ